MPNIWLERGLRFFFYSREGTEPPHVHVDHGEAAGKWWLDPVKPAFYDGFTPAQVRTIERIIRERREQFMEAWRGYFKL